MPKISKTGTSSISINNSNIESNNKELIINDLNYYSKVWNTFMKDANSSRKDLVTFRQFAALGVNNSHKNQGLTLATVHTVKGLQYDIVFVMGMNDGTFPDFRAKTELELQTEKNVAYVAVTRAKRWIYLTYPECKIMPWGDCKQQVISRFLK